MSGRTLGLVACSAGGIEDLRTHLIEPLQADGWTVAVTVTPTAGTWLRASGEWEKLEAVTGLPVRDQPRLPGEESPHPPVNCYAVVPATASTVAKLALGVSDNQALTSVNEAIGNEKLPVVIFPRVNAAHARHPAWQQHIAALTDAGVHLIYGDVWPLHEPRSEPNRSLPWEAIRSAISKPGSSTSS